MRSDGLAWKQEPEVGPKACKGLQHAQLFWESWLFSKQPYGARATGCHWTLSCDRSFSANNLRDRLGVDAVMLWEPLAHFCFHQSLPIRTLKY